MSEAVGMTPADRARAQAIWDMAKALADHGRAELVACGMGNITDFLLLIGTAHAMVLAFAVDQGMTQQDALRTAATLLGNTVGVLAAAPPRFDA